MLAELAAIAFSDIRRYVTAADGRVVLVPNKKLVPGDAGAIAFVAPAGRRTGARLRLHDKVRALRALMRHLGLRDERIHVDPLEQDKKAMAVLLRIFREAGIAPPPGVLPAPDAPA